MNPDPKPPVLGLLVDEQNPWPGLESFTENLHAFFYGRDAESENLFRMVTRDQERLTVLYGMSGLGKSSLLQAGLFPRLREANHLPIYIRLDYTEATPNLKRQVRDEIRRVLNEYCVDTPAPSDDEPLWCYFHRQDVAFWSKRNRPLIPVLILDQFEEFFTQGAETEARRQTAADFIVELADLIANRVPSDLQQRWDNANDELDSQLRATYRRQKEGCRIILSLREDYLGSLEELTPQIPPILDHLMRLGPMDGNTALAGVEKPGAAILDNGVARQIVLFVSGKDKDRPDNAGSGLPAQQDQMFKKLIVEPAYLSLFCRELNEERLRQNLPKITRELLLSRQGQIIEGFYQRCFTGLPDGARVLVETKLITKNYRDSLAVDNIPAELARAIETLVKKRLLRYDYRAGLRRIELAHDLLVGVVRECQARRIQEDVAKKNALIDKVKKRNRRIIKWAVASGTVSVLLISSLIIYVLYRIGVQSDISDCRTRLDTAIKAGDVARQNNQTADALNEYTAAITNALAYSPDVRSDSGIQDDLSSAYYWAGCLEETAGQLPAALSFYEDYRDLSQKDASLNDDQHDHWLRELSVSYNKIGGIKEKQNDLDGALASYQAEAAICEQLATNDPTNTKRQDELATSYNWLGDVLEKQKKLPEACEFFQKNHQIYALLATNDATNTQWQNDLYVSDDRLGTVLQEEDKLNEALDYCQDEIKITGRLAGNDPTNAAWLEDLAQSHYDLACGLEKEGKFTSAVASFQEENQIYAQLTTNDPANTDYQFGLGVSFSRIAWDLEEEARLDEALADFQNYNQIFKQLPANNSNKRELAMSYANLASVLIDQGKYEDALAACTNCQQIMMDLVTNNPTVSDWREDMAWNFWRFTRICLLQKRLDAAMAWSSQFVDTMSNIVSQNPSTTQFESDQAWAFRTAGDVQLASGDYPDAFTNYNNAVTILVRLTTNSTTDIENQRDLATTRQKLVELLEQSPALGDAAGLVDQCLTNQQALILQSPDMAKLQGGLARLYQLKGRACLQASPPDTAEARRQFQLALDTFAAMENRQAQLTAEEQGWRAETQAALNALP